MRFDYDSCRIILEDRYGVERIEKCQTFEGFRLVVTTELVLPLLEFLKRYYMLIYKLTDIALRDINYLFGTHNAKNQALARLRKFVRVFREISKLMESKVVSLYDLFEEELDDIEEMVMAMNTVRDEYHRVRDPVHQLFYPHLRRRIESIMKFSIEFPVYSDHRRSISYTIGLYFDKRKRRVEVDVVRDIRIKDRLYAFKHATFDEVKKIIEKRIERRKRREWLRNEQWKYREFLFSEHPVVVLDVVTANLDDFFRMIENEQV